MLDEIPTLGNTKENLTAAVKTENVRQYLTNCTYLQDELITLYGLKIYGKKKGCGNKKCCSPECEV